VVILLGIRDRAGLLFRETAGAVSRILYAAKGSGISGNSSFALSIAFLASMAKIASWASPTRAFPQSTLN